MNTGYPTSYTINQIADIFTAFAIGNGTDSGHRQLNSVFVGDIKNVPNNIEYPILILTPPSTSLKNNQIIYSIDVLLLDRIHSDSSNAVEVYSDMLQVGTDLYSYLQNANVYNFIIDPIGSFEPVTDEINSDWVVGQHGKFEIRMKFDYNVCQIPGVLPPSYFSSGGTYTPIQSVYLTCSSLSACSTFNNYINNLQTQINNLSASTGNSTTYTFSAATNLTLLTSSTNPNVVYSLSDSINVPFEISGGTFYSGSTPLQDIIYNISSIASSAYTFSAGADNNLYVSRTGNTIEYGMNTAITVSEIYSLYLYNYGDFNNQGNFFNVGTATITDLNVVNSLSAASFQQTDVLDNIFSGHTTFYEDVEVVNNLSSASINVSNQIDTVILKATGNVNFTSAATINILSANTIVSAGTNLNQVFAGINHTHNFSAITNTAHTHNISDVIELSNQLSTKANLSGANFTVLSSSTIFSGSSELSTLFPYDVSKYRTIGTTTLERWYCSANINSTLNSATLTTNVLRFVPFIISNRTTVDRIGIEVAVSGSSASNARLGIYDVSGGTIPNNLVEDFGTVDISLAGAKSININRTLNHNSAVAPQFRIIAAGQGNNILGSPSTLGTGIGNVITASYSYAALPNNCSGLTLTVATTSAPAIYLRFSA